MNKEEAIKIVRSHYPANKQMLNEALEFLIPELKEDENEKIRKVLIKHLNFYTSCAELSDGVTAGDIIAWLEKQVSPEDKGEISDGYHTFNELYYYRMLYNAAFFNSLPKVWVHKSKKHHDGEECFGGGWFIVMANLPTGQISNHYELKDWELFQIPEKEVADEWDGHTPKEAAERLHKYLLMQKEQEILCAKCRKEFPYSSCQEITDFGSCFIECESKKVDEVKPNFHVGDSIKPKVGSYGPFQVSQVDSNHHKYILKDGYVIDFSQEGEYELVEQTTNPYSGASFDYNNHTWGMCARDNGVEILIDSEIKAFISLEKSFIYPTPLQYNGTSKVRLVTEAIKEEKVDNANKVEPKFHEGDLVVVGGR